VHRRLVGPPDKDQRKNSVPLPGIESRQSNLYSDAIMTEISPAPVVYIYTHRAIHFIRIQGNYELVSVAISGYTAFIVKK
jgi:hypothetical protein